MAALAAVRPADAQTAAPDEKKIEGVLLTLLPGREADFWVTFRAEADLAPAEAASDWEDKGELVVDELQDTAESSQARVLRLLDDRQVPNTAYWISNTVKVTGDRDLIVELAAFPEVEQVTADRSYELTPPGEAPAAATEAVEWNIAAIGAPEVWSTFATRGEGIVVANIDTGVDFAHPALVGQYRGNLGDGSFSHDYNWFDPAHVCGNPSLIPCDNNSHGTHTMGTMVGDDRALGGANQVGVAPGARWMAAKGCESSSCSQTSLLASGQWILAPTDLAGNNPRPDLRPNVVNNSWGGAGGRSFYQDIVTAWEAAGVFPVFSNGNSGPSCGSAGSPGDYPNSYAVGAYDAAGKIASFSSRGSASGSTMKPNISAPGVAVRSSLPGGGYGSKSGTSMAAPHVAGAVALLWSANPGLVSDVAFTRDLLDRAAHDVSDLACGGIGADNGVWGEGRLDVLAAVTLARTPRGTLGGSVTTDGGAAVPGAAVEAVGPLTYASVTGAEGAYGTWLPVGTYEVTARAFGLRPQTRTVVIVAGGAALADIVLPVIPVHRVAGTVRDPLGTPVAGATVSMLGTPIGSVLADVAGGFSFPTVPEGSYTISGTPSGGCLVPAQQAVVVDGDESLDVTLARKVDGFGYSCSPVTPPGYVEAGTPLVVTGSDATAPVTLPFPFSFYGTSYTTAQISTNGLLTFGAPSTRFSNTRIPDPGAPNAVIFPYWDDLFVDGESSVRTQLAGTEPDRTFTVEWRNVRYHSVTTKRIDFEVVLHQSGQVELHYRNIADDAVEQGSSATIGIENATGTVGLEFAYLAPPLPVGSSSVLFTTAAAESNTPPDAVDDSVSLAGGTVAVPVLANDSDPDGDVVTLTGASDPPHGVTTLVGGGKVTYTPDAGFAGTDSFTYDVADPFGGTDRATVSVTVERGENHVPVAAADTATTAEEVPVTVHILANDTDGDGDPLVVTAVSGPAHGTAALMQNPTSINYTPAGDYHGPDSFTYDVGDGYGGSARATVTVTVTPTNDAPRPGGDAATTAEDTSVIVPVLANDVEPDGDPVSVTSVLDVTHGIATVGGDGRVTFVPAANYNGPASFRYQVTDVVGLSNTAMVSIAVTPVDDPTVALADAVRTGVNTTTEIDVVANDSDPDGPVRVISVANPPHGTASISAGKVMYSPDSAFAGTDTFSYVAGDGLGPNVTGMVTVTVSSKTQPIPLSVWTFPGGDQGLDGVGGWIVPGNEPTAGAGQVSPKYRYSLTFPFSDPTSTATVALSIEGGQKYASFLVTRPSGAVDTVRIPFPWAPNRAYLLLAGHVGNGLWQATVMDWASGGQKFIGAIQAGPQLRTAYPVALSYLSWSSLPATDCSAYPLAQATFTRPIGVRGGSVVYAGSPTASNRPGDCPFTNAASGGVQLFQVLGQAPS